MRRHSRRLGMTMIETTICAAVGAAVLGMIWTCYDQTDKVARRQILQAHALDEALMISNTISAALSQSLNPAAYGVEKPAGTEEKFRNRRIALYSRAGASADAPWQLVVIENKPTSDDGESRAVAAKYGSREQMAGGQSDLYNSDVEFFFADAFDENIEPQIQEQYPENQRPRFVRYRVTVQDRAKVMTRPVILNSGVALP